MVRQRRTACLRTPIGILAVSEAGGAIVQADFFDGSSPAETELSPELGTCLRQLREYFEGQRREFEVKLAPEGTDFQKRVWAELLKVPYGATTNYGRIAESIGRPGAARAVGAANGRNPVSIIIPCHRVLGAGGELVGYGGGLWRKEWLLRHEAQGSLRLV